MTNQLGDPRVTPRSYSRHLRYSRYGRRHGKQFLAFLAAQAARLVGIPSSPPETASQQVFEKLSRNTAADISKAVNYSDLA
jgi:hypothetical protein